MRTTLQARSFTFFAKESTTSRALATQLAKFPEVVEAALRTHKANLLCDYLYETSQVYATFWNKVPVLRAEEPALVASRLALVEAMSRVLGRGLDVLGIRALDRM